MDQGEAFAGRIEEMDMSENTDREQIARRHDAEKAEITGQLFDAFNEIKRLQESKRIYMERANKHAIEANRMRALVKGGIDAINAAICQTQAEQAGHERTADKYCRTVEQWRKDARAALTDEQGKS